VKPPSTYRVCPFTYALAGLHRNTAAPARSAGVELRAAIVRAASCRALGSSAKTEAVSSVWTKPGAIAFDVMPSYPCAGLYASARARVRPSTPDFAAAYGSEFGKAKSETALEKRLYQAIPHWTGVITGDSPHARRYWANGTLPTRVAAPGGAGRSERLACPSTPGARTPLHASQPECEAWWPVDTSCVAYVIGVGDLPKGRQDAWGFPVHAAKRGCIVHAYDPTIALRQRQQAAAQRIALKLTERRKGRQHGNLTFHFAGLGAGRSRNTINSFGAIDGTVLYTMAETAVRPSLPDITRDYPRLNDITRDHD